MKGFLSARSDYFIGYATVAAIVGSDGAKTSLEGCVAKMVVLTDGKNAAQVLAIAPPSEFEKAVLQSDSYDWVERWRRVRIYHAPDESQEFAKASKRVERVLDRILKQHTAHADPSVAESVFEEALVKKRVPDKCGDGDVKLEIADVNALDADELEHLLAQVPNEWKPIIKTSGPKDYVVEVEGQYIHEDTRSWWLTPTFAKGVGVFGLGVVSGVGLAALYSYLNGSQDGYSSARVSGPEYTYNPTPSDAATHSPTPLDATIYHDATGYHSTLSDVATPIVLVRNASECVSSGADKCGVGPIKPPFDGASMISAQELAVLKAGSCREAFADLKAPLIEATMNGWEQLDWSDCADSGGWVICTDDRSSISECYSFGFPYRFDFPTVWEAVVHRLKPSKCSFRCNKRLVAYRKYLQRGWVLTESIGEDPFRSSERHIHDVGLAYPGLDYYGQSGCSQRYEDHCEPRISGADCYCPEATFWANVTAPSGKKIRWGTINHINTYAEDLIRYYTAFKRRGYKVTQCGFECRRLQKSSFDDALHVTQLAFYHGPLAGEPPMNRSRYLDSLFL